MRWLTYDLKIVVLTSIYGTVRSFIYVVYCLTITIVYVFLTHFIWNEWFRERDVIVTSKMLSIVFHTSFN